jgi:adenylylsulfate kinase-like enzyme
MIFWFTGQPGHGKTTLALALIERLEAEGHAVFHVDGDDLRALTGNADYSRGGREANIRRAQTIAHYLHNKGQIAVVSLVAPYRAIREELKAVAPVHEVYVHTTELRGREDKAAADYEAPTERFIDIDTTNRQVDECLSELLARVEIQTTS